jgi:hypothetical protein
VRRSRNQITLLRVRPETKAGADSAAAPSAAA